MIAPASSRRRRWFLIRFLWMLVFVLLALSHFLILHKLSAWMLSPVSSKDDDNESNSLAPERRLFALKDFSQFAKKPDGIIDGGTNKKYASEHQSPASESHSTSRKSDERHASGSFKQPYQSYSPRKSIILPQIERETRRPENTTLNDPSLLKLKEQGIDNIPEHLLNQIPSWSQITDLFGSEPVILGLDTCEAYRRAVPMENRSVSPAGIFNTGTNLFNAFFHRNCAGPFPQYLLQVPWGKHNLAQARLDNYTINKPYYDRFQHEHVLPVVMIRHPVTWMFSTCLHSYGAHWIHNQRNCPHLVHENKTDGSLVPVHVGYGYNPSDAGNKRPVRYDSLIHLWKDWYKSYVTDFPYPRLIIRLEDVVYQPQKVLETICSCAGGTKRHDTVRVPEESVKKERDRMGLKMGRNSTLTGGSRTAGFLEAWINHASISSLWKRMPPRDQRLVKQVLRSSSSKEDDNGLLKKFHYKIDGLL